MSTGTPKRSFRCDGETWNAAIRKAADDGTSVAQLLVGFLRNYVRPSPAETDQTSYVSGCSIGDEQPSLTGDPTRDAAQVSSGGRYLIDGNLIGPILPGERILIESNGTLHRQTLRTDVPPRPSALDIAAEVARAAPQASPEWRRNVVSIVEASIGNPFDADEVPTSGSLDRPRHWDVSAPVDVAQFLGFPVRIDDSVAPGTFRVELRPPGVSVPPNADELARSIGDVSIGRVELRDPADTLPHTGIRVVDDEDPDADELEVDVPVHRHRCAHCDETIRPTPHGFAHDSILKHDHIAELATPGAES